MPGWARRSALGFEVTLARIPKPRRPAGNPSRLNLTQSPAARAGSAGAAARPAEAPFSGPTASRLWGRA
jgi:hypothetical protein